jgi:hypothetical protein
VDRLVAHVTQVAHHPVPVLGQPVSLPGAGSSGNGGGR